MASDFLSQCLSLLQTIDIDDLQGVSTCPFGSSWLKGALILKAMYLRDLVIPDCQTEHYWTGFVTTTPKT